MSNIRRAKQNTNTIHPDMKTRITIHREGTGKATFS